MKPSDLLTPIAIDYFLARHPDRHHRRGGPFPEARRSAWKFAIDFGEPISVRRSSAQITDLYHPKDLIGRQVAAVVNPPPPRIDPFLSGGSLSCSNASGRVVLVRPDAAVTNGTRLL